MSISQPASTPRLEGQPTGSPLHLAADDRGSFGNAAYLCEACELAYLSESPGRAAFRERLGLDARLVSVGNTQAWLGIDAANIVVAFRGTESPESLDGLKDILLTDAMNLLVVPEGRLGHDLASAGVGARFHKGFVDAIAAVWEPLSAAIEQELAKAERPVWLTGHSLGGALALFAGWLLKRRFVAVHEIATFGAPMIGNHAACQAFNREFAGRIQRFVNGRDPVPKLPSFSLVANEFAHVESERLLGREPMTGLADMLGSLASTAANGLLAGTIIDEVWKSVSDQVAAHYLGRYRDLLGSDR